MLAALAALALTASPADTIRLTPGGQEVLRIPGLKRVAIVQEDTASVRVTGPAELLVTGKQPGRTSLTLWTEARVLYKTIVVDSGRASDIARMVKEQVSPTLDVQDYNGRIVIDGTLDAVDELERLKLLVGDDPNVKLLVRMNPRVLPFLALQITQAFQHAHLRSARATAIGDTIFLEGSVADAAELRKAQAIAEALYAHSRVGLAVR
jgi:hypothetical protein